MYVNLFWTGVLVTILVEFIIFLLLGLFAALKISKDERSERNDKP